MGQMPPLGSPETGQVEKDPVGLVDVVGPRATPSRGPGSPEESLLPLGGGQHTACVLPHPGAPTSSCSLSLGISSPAFPAPCTDTQSGQGPSQILLSLCLCPEGRAVSRLGLFTSIPGPQQLLTLANSYTAINTQPSLAGKPGSE